MKKSLLDGFGVNGRTNGLPKSGLLKKGDSQEHKEDLTSSGIGSFSDDFDDGEGSSLSRGTPSPDPDSNSNTDSDPNIKEEEAALLKVMGKLRGRHYSFGALAYARKKRSKQNLTQFDVKRVRFADALGLDLVEVKTFDQALEDRLWSAASANADPDPEDVVAGAGAPVPTALKELYPLFQQPVLRPGFAQKVCEQKVCLERAYLDMDGSSVIGMVRVLNMDYHKAVYIRWTFDEWKTMMDYRANYVDGSNDTVTDKFKFKIYAPLDVGQSLIFAVRFHCAGQQFWDNNQGANYKFLCQRRLAQWPRPAAAGAKATAAGTFNNGGNLVANPSNRQMSELADFLHSAATFS